jgi:hypothetical protein
MTAEGVTQDRVMRHRVITGLRTLRRHHRARPGDPDGLTRRASRAGHDVVGFVLGRGGPGHDEADGMPSVADDEPNALPNLPRARKAQGIFTSNALDIHKGTELS